MGALCKCTSYYSQQLWNDLVRRGRTAEDTVQLTVCSTGSILQENPKSAITKQGCHKDRRIASMAWQGIAEQCDGVM